MNKREGKRWLIEEVLMAGLAILLGFAFALTLLGSGCSTIEPWKGVPYWEPFKPVQAVGEIPPQPGDEVKVQVPAGALRQSLLVAEEYDALVPFVNEQFEFANQIAKQYDELLKHDAKLYWSLKMRTIMATGIGIGTGILVGAGVSLLIPR